MMRWYVARNDLRFMVRSQAFRAALLGTMAVTGALTITTTVTPPLDMRAASSVPSLAALRVILALAIPWMVARQLSLDRGDRLVELIANASMRPADMLEGKMMAAAAWAGIVIIMCTPPLAVAWSSSQVASSSLALPGLGILAMALLAIVLSTHLCVMASARLRSWTLATAASLAALLALQLAERFGGAVPSLLVALSALVALTAWLRVRANAGLRSYAAT